METFLFFFFHGRSKALKEVLLEIYSFFYTSQTPFPPISALQMPPIFKYPTLKHTHLQVTTHTHPVPITALPGFIATLESKYWKLQQDSGAAVSESVFSVCAFIWEEECWRDKRFKKRGGG